VVPGTRFRVGERRARSRVLYKPCKTIKGSFVDGKFVRIAEKLHPGWSRVYARVHSEGPIRSGDPVEVTPRLVSSPMAA